MRRRARLFLSAGVLVRQFAVDVNLDGRGGIIGFDCGVEEGGDVWFFEFGGGDFGGFVGFGEGSGLVGHLEDIHPLPEYRILWP